MLQLLKTLLVKLLVLLRLKQKQIETSVEAKVIPITAKVEDEVKKDL